jgi:hypothetical protein
LIVRLRIRGDVRRSTLYLRPRDGKDSASSAMTFAYWDVAADAATCMSTTILRKSSGMP